MELLYQNLLKDESIQTILNNLAPGEIINLSNINNSFKEVLTGLIATQQRSRILYVTATDYQAQNTARHLQKILGEQVLYCPAEPIHDYFADVHSQEINHQRLVVFEQLLSHQPLVVVMGAETLLKKQLPREKFQGLAFSLAVEENWDPVILTNRLFELGYEPVSQVEARGQYAHRGGIIDVFSTTGQEAYRIEFFGDMIESLRTFDPQTQLSSGSVDQVIILPGREIILDQDERAKALKQITKNYGEIPGYQALIERISEDPGGHDETLFAFIKSEGMLTDYLGDALVIWDEPPRIKEAQAVFINKLHSDFQTLMDEQLMFPEEKNKFYSFTKIEKALEGQTQLRLHLFTSRAKKGLSLDLGVKENDSFLGQIPRFIEFVQKQLQQDAIIHLRARDEAGLEKLKSFLTDADIHRFTNETLPGVQLATGEISGGFELTGKKLICLNQSEIIKESSRGKKRRRQKGRKIDSFTQLNQ